MNNKAMINRLKRAQGQLGAVIRMIEEENTCSDVLTQLSAVRSSVDKAVSIIGVNNLLNCVDMKDEKQIQEAVDLLLKSKQKPTASFTYEFVISAALRIKSLINKLNQLKLHNFKYVTYLIFGDKPLYVVK